MRRSLLLSMILGALIPASVVAARPAAAATYVVNACQGSGIPGWQPEELFFLRPAAACPWSEPAALGAGLSVSTPASITGPGIGGGWALTAPQDVQVIAISGQTASQTNVIRPAGREWFRGVWNPETGASIIGVPLVGGWTPFSAEGFAARKIMLGLRCLMSNSCDVITMVGQTQYSGVDWVAFRGLRLTLRDDVKPQLVVAQPLSDGWHGAERTSVSFTATDNVGIAGFAAFVDGKRLADLDRHCYGASSNVLPAPCAETSAPWSAAVDLSQVAHGSHVLVISAVDPAGNIAERAFPLLVDHNAPATPRALRIASGTGWRSENRFDVAWANPADGDESPIAGADYELCPATNAPYDSSGCVGGQVRGEGLSELSALELPGDGAWRLSLSLRDAAGNADRDRAATLDGLRLDREPPAAAFAPLAPSDPTRVRLTASDAASGLAGVTVEARRRGEAEWRALSAQPEAGGYSAVVDDEQLPAGRYELRARVNDQAGNQRIVAALADGQPLELQLPLRGGTALSVGRSTRVRVKSARGKPRYHRVLVRKPHAGYGSAVALTGRVTNAAGNPRSQVPVEVLERVDLPGLEWRHLATVTTGSSGSFTFRALPGPARALRFRYPGTATTRPSVEEVELRVRAGVTLIPSRDYVRNGHSVVFRGRLLGRPIPREGKLLTLQALTSRGWRTFATPRAGGRDGRWTYRYHFTDTTSTVRYAFRVIAPKEAGYPYEEGISRVARVLVLGRG